MTIKSEEKRKGRIAISHGKKIAALTDLNLPARSSLFFTFINLFTKAAAFVFTPIYTRLLSPEEYGEYSLFGTLLSVSLVISSLELSGGVIMRAHQREKESHSITTLIATLLTFFVTIPVFLAVFLIKRVTGGGMSFPYAYLLLLIMTLSTNTVNLFLSHSKYVYRWQPSFAVALLQSVIAPLSAIFIISLSDAPSGYHVTLKFSVSVLLTSLVAIYMLIRTVLGAKEEICKLSLSKNEFFRLSIKKLKLLLKLALPLLPYYISISAISGADKLIISHTLGKAVLAPYAVAFSAGVALSGVYSGVNSALCPWLMRKIRAGECELAQRSLGMLLSLFASLSACFILLAPEALSLLAPSAYSIALPVTLISAIAPIPLAAAQCSSSIAIAKERTCGVLFAGVIPATLAITLGAILIPRFGAPIGALIAPISYTASALIEAFNLKRINGRAPFRPSLLLIATACLSLTAIITYLLKDSLIYRLIPLAFASLLTLYMLKRSLPLLKERRQPSAQEQ